MGVTRLARIVRAPRSAVYGALVDADAVRQWMVPDGMTSEVHRFDAREGGEFRISLTYDAPTGAGKTSARTDTFHGRFLRLVPDTEVVQSVEFETDDPALQGEMRITWSLADRTATCGETPRPLYGWLAGDENRATVIRMPAGIRITVARFLSPSQQPYSGRGVTPTHPLAVEDEDLLAEARRLAVGLLAPRPLPLPMQ